MDSQGNQLTRCIAMGTQETTWCLLGSRDPWTYPGLDFAALAVTAEDSPLSVCHSCLAAIQRTLMIIKRAEK